MLDQLNADHGDLRRIMREFAALMGRGADRDRSLLLRRRVDFSQAFRRHLGTLDALARPSGDIYVASIAQGINASIRLLQGSYSAHLQRWTPANIDADWPTYRRDVLALQRPLLDLLDRQERDLLPLLAQPRRSERAAA